MPNKTLQYDSRLPLIGQYFFSTFGQYNGRRQPKLVILNYKLISINQELILLAIQASPGTNSAEITRTLTKNAPPQWRTFQKGSVSKTVKGLAKEGLIRRIEQQSDSPIAKNTKQSTQACFITKDGTEVLQLTRTMRSALEAAIAVK